jgi:hypothetical protein
MELERLDARYQKLYKRNQPSRDAAEMASLAEHLGRWFEAKVYLTVAAAVGSGRENLRGELTRLGRHAANSDEVGRTLAGLLAPELDGLIGSAPENPLPSSYGGASAGPPESAAGAGSSESGSPPGSH